MSKFASLREFSKDISVTQISFAARAVFWHLRSFWLCILLLCVGLTVFQSADLLNTYFKYEKQAIVSIENRANRPFPAVTVCNLNSLKRSAVEKVPSLSVLLYTPSHKTEANLSQVQTNALDNNSAHVRKKRTASCWSHNSAKYYHIRNIRNNGLLQRSDSNWNAVTQIPSISAMNDTLLWQFIPYSDPNDDFYVIYNKQNNEPMYFHGENHDLYTLRTTATSLACTLNRKFKIVDDKSGTGCNIMTADSALYVGIPSCPSGVATAFIQRPSNGTDCQTFAMDEMSDVSTTVLSAACNQPLYGSTMSSQSMEKSGSIVKRQSNSTSINQMWYFKQWSLTLDGTYGIYNRVDNSMLTTRSGQLTVENVTLPSDTERFAIRPSDQSCFIFVSSPCSNLVLGSMNISTQNTVTVVTFSFDSTNTGSDDQLWRFAKLGSIVTPPGYSPLVFNASVFLPPCSNVEFSTQKSSAKTSSVTTSTSFLTTTSSVPETSAATTATTTVGDGTSLIASSLNVAISSETNNVMETTQTGNVVETTPSSTSQNAILASISNSIPEPVSPQQLFAVLQIDNNTDPLAAETMVAEAKPYLLSTLTTSQKMALGYSAKDFIVKCWYSRIPCDMKNDFVEWNDPDRGNCFTFNHIKTVNHYQSYQAGSNNGLSLILNASQVDYMPNTIVAGAIAIITNPNETIFTDRDFFIISPKAIVDVTISYINIVRLDPPYGNCVDSVTMDDYYYEGNYTIEGCLKTCHQKNVLKTCGCGDPQYPLPRNIPEVNKYCNLFSSSFVENCVDQVSANESTDIKQYCNCPPSCNDEVYGFKMNLLQSKKSRNKFEESLMFVNVYYANYITLAYEEVASYDMNAFFSDFGGLVGNYLNCSFISAFELIALALIFLIGVFS